MPSSLSTTDLLKRTDVRHIGDLYPDCYALLIYETVLDQIIDFSEQDRLRELGGFLVGTHHEDEKVVEIRRYLPAPATRQEFTSVTFTHDSWANAVREIDEKYAGESIVGWHHTHPGFGIFLSSYDLFIQKNFFSAPWQVAMVVDPRRQEFGFFQWRSGEVVDCGFLCLMEG